MRRLPALVFFLFSVTLAAAQPPKPADPPGEEKARELFRAGKFDDALKELQAVAKLDPKRPPPRVTIASYFFMAQQGQAARLALEAAVAEEPRHPEVYLLNASFAFGEGRITDAVLSCQTALTLAADPRWDPDQRKRFVRESRLGLAAAFEKRGDWTAARDHYASVLSDEPKNGNVRQRFASVVFHLGRPDEALKEFQTAHRDDPAVGLPELQMASLTAATQPEPAKTEDWLKKAVAAHPTDAKAPRMYAAWLLDTGNPEAAQLYLDAAVKLDPSGRETAALKGLMARHRKDYKAAETVFEGLVREYPAESPYGWNLALVLAETGDKEKQRRAIEIAENEARKNQKVPEAFAVLGWCYYKAGRIDEAERALSQVAQTGQMPSRDAAYFFGRLLADRQKWEDAQKVLKSAADAKGGYVYRADAQALLAEVEKKVPKKEEGKKP